MPVRPVVRHFMACKKEPTANGPEITLNDVFVHAIRPKPPLQYPVWQKTFFLTAILTNGSGMCSFRIEMRLVDLDQGKERETLVGSSQDSTFDFGRDRLKVWPFSFMMSAVLLPRAGVYRLYLICNGQEIACEEIHAR
ncbi:MAG: hypothetical protein L0Y71_25450 [Gemmataceae bacterium]|nr:hypothetical protein [Gemmataceae bacterium]